MKKLFVWLLGVNFLFGCSPFYLNEAMTAQNKGFEDRLPNLEVVFLNEESLENFTLDTVFIPQDEPMAKKFYHEVKTNLISEGEKKGYLVLLPLMNISRNGASLYTLLSVVTLGISAALGLPLTTYGSFTDLELNVLNLKGELIKKYTSQSFVQNKVGFYYGGCNSASNCYTKSSWDCYEIALDNIIRKVYRDREYLRKKLN